MTDIVKRLNEYAEGQWHPEDVSDLITDAADEIERLREAVMGLCVSNGRLGDENEELRREIAELREALYD